MITARIVIYLVPGGARVVDGWIPCAVKLHTLSNEQRSAMRPRIGVTQLRCASGKLAWFGFGQPDGCKLTDGCSTREEAMTEGIAVLDSIANLRYHMRERPYCARRAHRAMVRAL